eukprot:CAMPEP_0197655808 /NCGR_PEP_ID=MMETSP1338-20131121/39679_1 /TAXON_ID=43686 ORGANISM="Pelagodinium beii, Strain RCC1491" /NCGR_SAMPLE_ID=MMETSP1338 /ASSEMBLY_ACC=CAM_ASM_000754 /LENGTH=495 /DNA_ID=CAMNT_0043231527 /DNA_START=62 /DNA_END=1547 /DNA_ORIENTATION=+
MTKVKPFQEKSKAVNQERALKGGFREGVDREYESKAEKAKAEAGNEDQEQEGGLADEFKAEANTPITDKLPFNIFVLVTTFLNIFIIGLEQDVDPNGESFVWFLFEAFFACLFLGELIIRYMAARDTFFKDGWNIADLLLVVGSIVDCFVLNPAGLGGQIRFFTVIRALRVIRLVRLVRMFTAFRELWLLVGGLINSVKALSWVGCIIFMLIYVCGIICTAEIGQNDETYAIGPSYNGEVWPYKQYFGSVFRSMFTLFQVLTLDGWCDDIVRHVVYRQPVMGGFFIFFILLTSFGLMNVVVGIIVENTLAAAQVVDKRKEEKAAAMRKDVVEQLTSILERSDAQRSGLISLEELRAANQSAIVQKKFEMVGLKFDEVEHIFSLLDVDRSGKIELVRFDNACRELVGGGKRRDIAQVEVNMGTLANRLDKLDHKFTNIEKEVAMISQMTENFVHNTVRHLTGHDPTEVERGPNPPSADLTSAEFHQELKEDPQRFQ